MLIEVYRGDGLRRGPDIEAPLLGDSGTALIERGRVEMDQNAQPMVAMELDIAPVPGLRLGQLVTVDAFAETGRVVGKVTGIAITADGKSLTQRVTVERPA